MIPARQTRFHEWFFRVYTDLRIRRNFSEVIVHGDVPESGKPLLVVSNHFSWWDGFFILWLNNRYFHRRFYVMMLEEQLRKNMILNKAGAFSVSRKTRGIIESLEYSRNVLADRGNKPLPLLLMFPQGEIRSMHIPSLKFEKGIEKITRGIEGDIDLLMTAVLVDYFSRQKPELHYHCEMYPLRGPLKTAGLEEAYNDFLKRARADQRPEMGKGTH